MQSDSEKLVCLKGGLTVPVEPLFVLLDLENRGFRLTVDEDGGIVVTPGSLLTDDDRRLIRGWKPHIRALLEYTPPEVH